MTYTIVTAAYADPAHSLAIIETLEAGAVLIDDAGRPDEWAAMLAWGAPAEYAAPPLTVTEVTAAQAKLAFDAAGLLDDVEAMIAAHPVRAVRIWFADANVWERSHPYVSALGAEMSLDDTTIDALFAAASLY